MGKISTSISSFEQIIAEGYTYVDKTELIFNLLVSNPGHYFLARPRRFGKSLLVSTLEAIFSGNKSLFNNLAISNKDYNWDKFPVIHIDLGNITFSSLEALKQVLLDKLSIEADRLGVSGLSASTTSLRLEQLITNLSTKSAREIVLLIDEYDKPILDALDKPFLGDVVDEMRSFYSTIKAAGKCLHFSFMTGVSKFSKVSVFSGINNLYDLTADPRAADILGYTREEIEAYFRERITELGNKRGWEYDKTIDELKNWYDGYRFHHESKGVYNPVSIGNCLSSFEFRNYWFETGTPNFLFPILKKSSINYENIEAASESFGSFEPASPDPVSILFQTGYLSIKSIEWQEDRFLTYKFGFPNLEVKKSLSQAIVWEFSGVSVGDDRSVVLRGLAEALKRCDVKAFIETLKILFSKVPYDIAIQEERYYQTIVFLAMLMLDFQAKTEECTNVGRIDMVIETSSRIYIIEFKLDGGAEAAIDQIKHKKYAQKYTLNGKPIMLIGVSFSKEDRNIDNYLYEDYRIDDAIDEMELGSSGPAMSIEDQVSIEGAIPVSVIGGEEIISQNVVDQPVEDQPVKE